MVFHGQDEQLRGLFEELGGQRGYTQAIAEAMGLKVSQVARHLRRLRLRRIRAKQPGPLLVFLTSSLDISLAYKIKLPHS